ncbi:ribose-phosphate diphosphokinase [Thermoflavimicrobium daqui]|jgi:ribose-phosphate pyrophosphokinase|uniref:ribose-phosphate diphosphokinase n=1 Tax=Thermoflavimicrobium daqui TaxID=2137476 RepID=A0A364K580_9BACL|nr:ribose-phosphate diphosphokinase [Thermoflavimicrobium daqui]RAL24497.1 ribose-phosphate diphosphokinase [Thermoflavimicrobium daqui]
MENVIIFSGTSNIQLAEHICTYLQTSLGDVQISRFKSGEIYVRYEESIRNKDVFLIQTLSHPVNENLMELLVMADAARRASARSISAVIPYFAYARQEKKDAPREPITAKMIADILATVGIERVITIDLHAPAIQGFFNIPVDHLTALDRITSYLRTKKIEKPVVVSPDAGRVKTAEKLAAYLDAPFAIMMKKRPAHNKAKVTHIIGEVKGFTPIIIEDMIDTGGTIVKVVEKLMEKGAKPSYICATHPLFSDQAQKKLKHPGIREIVVTDTIPFEADASNHYTVLSMAPLLGKAIQLIQLGGSITTLFRS